MKTDVNFIYANSSDPAEEALYIKSEQVRQLYRTAPMGLVATAVNAVVLALFMKGLVPGNTLLIWVASLHLSVILRIFYLYKHRKHASSAPDADWINRFIALTAVSGALWGSASFFLFPYNSIAHQTFLTLMLGGMAAGAVVAYSSLLRAFMAFTVPIFIPLIMRLFMIGNEIHVAMGAMVLLFAVMIWVMAAQINDMTLTSFKLLFQNTRLVNYLASAKEQAEMLNKDLAAEIEERKKGAEELRKHREHLQELVAEQTAELSDKNLQLHKEIAERTRMQEALKASEEHFRSLIEDSLDIITVLDENAVITYLSPSVERLLGYRPEQLAGKNVFDYLHPEEQKATLEIFTRLVGTPGESDKTEVRFRHAGGAWHSLEVIGKSLMDESGKRRMIINSRDITERKEMEATLFRMQKLESLGILAGGLAHDFNNLLTSVIGNVDIVTMGLPGEGKLRERLAMAKKAAFRARDLTSQLLTFSKGGEPVKKTIELQKFLPEWATFAVRGADLRCEFSIPDTLWRIEGDEGQLSQAVNNLIINADQSMPTGGVIAVKCENIVIDANNKVPLAGGNYVKICIEDQGTGIPEEYRGKIFDPYFTTKTNGSGLGLATCHSIIKKHGGHIGVEPGAEAGSIFTIYLPASTQNVVGNGKKEKAAPRGNGRLLLMDDEEIVRDVAGQMLKLIGYQVTLAKDGSEAIETYLKAKEENRPFDAVIMDLTIPGGMGGGEAIKKLLDIDPDVKAIVSSGYSNDPIMANFGKYGFAAVLTKPYKVQDMKDTLYQVLKT